MESGYIYIRSNEYWDLYDAFKLGKTISIHDRDQTYITSEIKRGKYVMVIEVDLLILDKIESQLQLYFNSLNLSIKFDAGTEFYKKEIINLIILYLDTVNVRYKILSTSDINALTRKIRIKDSTTLHNLHTLHTLHTLPTLYTLHTLHTLHTLPTLPTTLHTLPTLPTTLSVEQTIEQTIEQIANIKLDNEITDSMSSMDNMSSMSSMSNMNSTGKVVDYKPRDYQTDIIDKATEYFQLNEKGLLIIPCGVGKTLISLWVTQALKSNKILIGVPNTLLLKQWECVISVLFRHVPYLIVSGKIDTKTLILFLINNKNKCIVITTYASVYKVYHATRYTNFVFDIKINDEVHHLTAESISIEYNTKKYIQMLNIHSIKQLSLTATIKQLENINDDENVVSNDNVKYFGNIIDRKCLLWAINKNIICDYIIQTIITDEEELEQHLYKFNITEENNKRLFLSAYATLKSIYDGYSHHLLIYLNNRDNAKKLIQYIKMILHSNYFIIPDLYYSSYHSEINFNEQKTIINNFEKAKFGIITCVYCLGEGYDNHNIDAVVFAENMGSNIRIVQSALRASRKNKHQPDKITKIILPILNKLNWLENNDNSDFKKVKEIIYQMGLEDETIAQKIKVFKIEVKKHDTLNKKNINNVNNVNDFGYYDDELTEKIKLKTIKRAALAITYEKARKIILDKNIKSKEEYFKLCEVDSRLSNDPEIVFKGQFTNWIEYLSIKRVYYDLKTCKKKIEEYLQLYPEIKNHYLDLSIIIDKLCKIDVLFPPNGLWVEYYNVKDLRDLITVTNNIKKNSTIL